MVSYGGTQPVLEHGAGGRNCTICEVGIALQGRLLRRNKAD